MYMLRPGSQLPARFKMGRAHCRHVYVYVRTRAAPGSAYVHARIHSRRRLPSFCCICLKSLLPILCQCPVSACEHDTYSYPFTYNVGCLSAISTRTFASCLVPISCICLRAWQSLAIRAGGRFTPSYQASHCFGPASCKVGQVVNRAGLLQNGSARFKSGRVANRVVTYILDTVRNVRV